MLSVRENVAHLYLGTSALALESGDVDAKVSKLQFVVSRDPHDYSQKLTQLLSSMKLRSWRKPRLRAWFSGGLCRSFLLDVPDGLKSHLELQSIAAGLAPDRTGIKAPCTVWVDMEDSGPKRVVAAVNTQTLHSLTEACATAGVHLLGVAPWWSAVQRVLATRFTASHDAEIVLRDPESVTVFRCSKFGFSAADTWFPVADDVSAATLKRRLSLDEAVNRLQRVNAHMQFETTSTPSAALNFAFAKWTAIEL